MEEVRKNDEWGRVFGGEEEIESWLMAELVKAFYLARKAKRGTNDERRFENRLVENLLELRDDILDGTYRPGSGIAFIVHEPVIREIFAAPFRDRVVHHFLFNGVAEWWDRRLIYDCYSCRVGKGTLFGIKRLEHHIMSVSKNGQRKAYSFKLDVQGYFMSLPRKELFSRIVWGLERQFPRKGPRFEIYKRVWREVIFDDPTRIVERRGALKDWDKLPKSKSLFCQPEGKGIVIGNLSSQLLSNIYLDLLDRFVMFDLGYRHYGRYVDDFFVIVNEEEFPRMRADLKLVSQFLTDLGLKLHPRKIHIQEVKKGTEFLGAVVYPGRVVTGKRIEHNYRRALREVQEGRRELDTIVSYMGILKNWNGTRVQERIFEELGMEFKV